jgi:hypothetical protein
MMPFKSFSLKRSARFIFLLLISVALVGRVQAEELKIEAKLIWGTDDEKSTNATHTAVDEALAKELRKTFKWKNYFQIHKENGVVPSRGTKQFKMSKQCVIEITELEGPKVEVKLIGEGKPVNKTVQALSRGAFFTIGGESKNGCAWFVVVQQVN